MLTGYFAAEEFREQLLTEIGGADLVHGRLLLKAGPPVPAAWAQNVWHDVLRIGIDSIGDADRKLRAIQRNWVAYAHELHRRTALIQAKLPPIRPKPHVFPKPAPTAPLGCWTLLDERTLLAAPRCSSPFPHGEVRFAENKSAPPNRAYLKLWEALTLAGSMPGKGDRCLDLGASPGGWTWVLQQLGASVVAVDKAPLDPGIAALPAVEQRLASAFSLDPAAEPPVDWLCSDVVCYPARLLALVQRWMAAGKARNFVCTLKFQGATDHDAARAFAAIPGSRLMHLYHNKHELTWIRLAAR